MGADYSDLQKKVYTNEHSIHLKKVPWFFWTLEAEGADILNFFFDDYGI